MTNLSNQTTNVPSAPSSGAPPTPASNAQQAVAAASAAAIRERRRLSARFVAAISRHPHTMLALLAAAVVIAVALGLLRG